MGKFIKAYLFYIVIIVALLIWVGQIVTKEMQEQNDMNNIENRIYNRDTIDKIDN